MKEFALSLSKELKPGEKVLDAGAGECPYKDFFKEQEYTAVDTKLGDADFDYSKIDFIVDLAKMPFKEKTFDAALCTQVLEHVSEPGQVLKEIYRVLKKGGLLYATVPQSDCVHEAPYDYFRFTPYSLKYLLEKAGYEIMDIKPSCGYFGILGHRLAFFPRIMFWQTKSRFRRIILFPLEILSYLFFALLFPIVLNAIDFLDKERDFTLFYFVRAVKP